MVLRQLWAMRANLFVCASRTTRYKCKKRMSARCSDCVASFVKYRIALELWRFPRFARSSTARTFPGPSLEQDQRPLRAQLCTFTGKRQRPYWIWTC